MEIGVSTACLFGRSIVEDSLRTLKKLGTKRVEVYLNTFLEYQDDFIDQLNRIIEESELEVYSVHPHGIQYEPQLFSHYDRSQEDAFAIYRQVLKAASRLGANCMVFHGAMHFKPARKQMTLDFDWIGKTVDRAANLAEEYGVRLAYENVHWCWFHYPEYAKSMEERITTKNLWFNLDVKQAAQSGYPLEAYLKTMGDRIVNIHLCDYKKQQDGSVSPCMPFHGEMPFFRLRQWIQETGYRGGMILEVYSENYGDPAELRQAREALAAFFEA